MGLTVNVSTDGRLADASGGDIICKQFPSYAQPPTKYPFVATTPGQAYYIKARVNSGYKFAYWTYESSCGEIHNEIANPYPTGLRMEDDSATITAFFVTEPEPPVIEPEPEPEPTPDPVIEDHDSQPDVNIDIDVEEKPGCFINLLRR